MIMELPDNTFIQDLGIAFRFGEKAVKETCRRCHADWKKNVGMYAAFVIALNRWCWHLYEINDQDGSHMFADLYYKYHDWALDNFKGDDARLYFELTD